MKKIITWMKVILLPSAISITMTSCQKDMEEAKTAPGEHQAQMESKSQLTIPDQIRFTLSGLYPEGVAYDRFNSRFLVSSDGFGTIGAVSYDGTYTPFIQDPALYSTGGLCIDEARKRVLVAITNTTGDLAKLGIFDLQTGQRIQIVDLGSLRPNSGHQHRAADLTVDPQGNVYITDYKSPIIYKVDISGNASVFFENDLFAEPREFPYYWVGFNGIVYDKNGFLIVAFYAGSFVGLPPLIKIPVNNPQNFSAVQLDVPISSADGLLLSRNGKELIVVDNNFLGPSEIVHMSSDDKWNSARRVESFPTTADSPPTTATSDGKDLFVIYPYVNKFLFDPEPPATEFMIQKAPFNIKSF